MNQSIDNFTIEVTGPNLASNTKDYVFISKDDPSVKFYPDNVISVNNASNKRILRINNINIFNKQTTLNKQINVNFTEFYRSEIYINEFKNYYDAKKKEITSFDQYKNFYGDITKTDSQILSKDIIPGKLLLRGKVNIKDANGNTLTSGDLQNSASYY